MSLEDKKRAPRFPRMKRAAPAEPCSATKATAPAEPCSATKAKKQKKADYHQWTEVELQDPFNYLLCCFQSTRDHHNNNAEGCLKEANKRHPDKKELNEAKYNEKLPKHEARYEWWKNWALGLKQQYRTFEAFQKHLENYDNTGSAAGSSTDDLRKIGELTMGDLKAFFQPQAPPAPMLADDPSIREISKEIAAIKEGVNDCKDVVVDQTIAKDRRGHNKLRDAAVEKMIEQDDGTLKEAAVEKMIEQDNTRDDIFASPNQLRDAAVEKMIERDDGTLKEAAVEKMIENGQISEPDSGSSSSDSEDDESEES